MQPFERLELEWATANDLDPEGMVACASGTAALHLALEALQLPAGLEVIVPDYTMIACPRAVTLAGLTPMFADCCDDLNIDVDQVADYCSKAGRRVGALMVVHVYGRQGDLSLLDDFAPDEHTTHDVKLVEDLAEAHGVRPHSLTDAACWSFYKNKIVAGEEGGAVWFRDHNHAALARELRSLGFTAAHDYRHRPRGHNYRMSNLHATAILQSLRMMEPNVQARRRTEAIYDAACPREWWMPKRDAPWVYDIRIPGMTRHRQAAVVQFLRGKGIGIEARHGFVPMHEQREYRNCQLVTGPDGSRASRISSEVIYLPLTPGTVPDETARGVFDLIRMVLESTAPEQG